MASNGTCFDRYTHVKTRTLHNVSHSNHHSREKLKVIMSLSSCDSVMIWGQSESNLKYKESEGIRFEQTQVSC